jgi:hypothetical protein
MKIGSYSSDIQILDQYRLIVSESKKTFLNNKIL